MGALEALLSLDTAADPRKAIELFVGRVLFEAGVWSSAHASDGIRAYRMLEHGPSRFRVCGQIWHIDQTWHLFFLDVERDATAASSTWTLFFDLDETSMTTRRARLALYALQNPADVTWLVTLEGHE